MKYFFAKEYENIQSSFIRDVLKIANQKDVISFAGGLPNGKLFPKKEIQTIFKKYSEQLPDDLFQYSATNGLEKLLNTIKTQFDLKGDILISNGSQQALDLISSIFLNTNDKILVEEPSYLGAIGLFKSHGAICHTVPLQEDGLDLEYLESKLQKATYKFFYIIPTFQNPSSITYSLKKRKALAKLAIKYNLILIEDDPYRFLNFKNRLQTTLYDLAPKNTLFIGSFSKILIPSLRVGYIMATPEILQKITVAKQYKDLHTNLFSQYVLYKYLTTFDIFKHIKILNKSYKKKCNFFYKTLKKELNDTLEVKKPKGGMFLWARLKNNADSKLLFEEAKKEKILYIPGSVFFQDKSQKSYLRLNFTNSSKKEIKEGIHRLKKILQ